MSEIENAVLDWIHSFEAGKQCQKIQDLSDGNILADILHEMCPDFFEIDALNRSPDTNWALAVSNIRTLLRFLDDYFRTVLGKKIDNSGLDVNGIARTKNVDEIVNLVELVVGVAVMCESKAVFIRNIFLLNPDSQAVLKDLVEHVLGRATDLDETEEDEQENYTGNSNTVNNENSVNAEEELIRTREMLQHLQNERQRLLHDARNLEIANESLKSQVAALREKTTLNEQEREALDGSDRQRVTAAEKQNAQLQKELDEAKKDLDLKVVETESLKAELRSLSQRFEASREIQAKLEMENHHQADELDVARDKIAKLLKAEQALERYQKKLEEMQLVKKQNKELSDKLDQYMDKIHDLESTNKSLSSLQKMVENYKNRAIELEREKFEAVSNGQIVEQQLQHANQENQKLIELRNRLEDQVRSLQLQVQSFEDEESEKRGFTSALDLSEDVESIPQLKEKVNRLERQLRLATTNSTYSSSDAENASGNVEAIVLLQQEIEELRVIRKEREESLISAKRQISDLQNEILKLQRSSEEKDKQSVSNQAVKELTQKLAATTNTVKLLEDRLKERETMINKLQQEKGKLESFSKRSLDTFKDKYMNILRTMQQEKKEFEGKIQAQTEKLKINQETWRREERLLSSALFEVGVKIMDRKIQAQLNEPAALHQNTFLGVQREALNKSAAGHLPANTPFTPQK